MKQSLWERFLMWVCDTFGHKPDDSDKWVYEGKTHSVCKRCGKVITAVYDVTHSRTDWK